MSEPKIPAAAKWRQVENINPGYWVLMDYEHNETKETVKIWSQVVMRLSLEQRPSGRKVEELRGNDTGGYGWDFRQYRGFQMLSLTQQQGKAAGLTIPEKPAAEGDDAA